MPSCASERARNTRFFWPPLQFADLAMAVVAHADALQAPGRPCERSARDGMRRKFMWP